MSTIDEIRSLGSMDLDAAAAYLGVDVGDRYEITGYGKLQDVDVLESEEMGIRFLLRDDDVVLVYVGAAALDDDVDAGVVAESIGTAGDRLRSRQGKRAHLHVVAEQGIAWSELDGQIGWMELFPPRSLAAYVADIYQEPPRFRQ